MESFCSHERVWPNGPYLQFLIVPEDLGYQAYVEAHHELIIAVRRCRTAWQRAGELKEQVCC